MQFCLYCLILNESLLFIDIDSDKIFQQGGSPKGHKTVSKENIAQSGEAVFVPCQTPQHGSRPSTSATSSNFQVSSSSYESSASGTGMSFVLCESCCIQRILILRVRSDSLYINKIAGENILIQKLADVLLGF